MKVLLIHYRYYDASGPEKYLFNVSNLLAESGHIVIPFSLNYPQNKKSEFSEFFPNPIINEFHIDKNKNEISFVDKVKIVINSFYNKTVYKKLNQLIILEKPDVAYILQYGTKLSISIFDACKKNSIPVVLRVSDFNLVCAKNIFYRNNEICTKCIESKFFSVQYKCVHDSYVQSFLYFLTQKFGQVKQFENKINAIVAPSNFTKELIKSNSQFSNSNFYHIPTFYNFQTNVKKLTRKYDLNQGVKICYWGRIEEDKGIDLLIDATLSLIFKGYNIELTIIGADKTEFARTQVEKVNKSGASSIYFKGYLPGNEIYEIVKEYHYSVIPSRWFDNMPNSLIESCLYALPPVVSGIGSLKELIEDGINGFSFYPISKEALANKIKSLFDIKEEEYLSISSSCKEWIKNYSNREIHYKKLTDLFRNVINERTNK